MTFDGFQDTLVADWASTSSIPMGADGVVTYSIDSSLSQYAGFIQNTIAQLDATLDVSFVEVLPDRVETTLVPKGRKGKRFHEVQTFVESKAELEFNTADIIRNDANIAGVADYQGDGEWDLIIKDDRTYSDAFNKYIILHELGHGLGLEHPFSFTDGDGITGLTGADTVMEYDWREADYFRDADVATLEGMWNDGVFAEADQVVAEAPSHEGFLEGVFTLSRRERKQFRRQFRKERKQSMIA